MNLTFRNLFSFLMLSSLLFNACNSEDLSGSYSYNITLEDETQSGTLHINKEGPAHIAKLISFAIGTNTLENLEISKDQLAGNFKKWGMDIHLDATYQDNSYEGTYTINDEKFRFVASRLSDETVSIDRSEITYMLDANDLQETELNIDHASLIAEYDLSAVNRGAKIYNANCINCHGNPELIGSIPLSLKFWEQDFKAGSDPFSMYQAISRGFKTMPPQLSLTPQEKHNVIAYIRETFIREQNQDEYFQVSPGYLAGLPAGTSRGPDSKPNHPWSDQDYGDFFINTYELVDSETGLERYHSPGPTPFPDEDYSKNNFAYKGIAVRLDPGTGGISKGKAWMIFDHDVMRVAGGWTGEGFIDWDAILLNDRHETYPRTIGKLHFETPVGPGWANPRTGKFDDPRFTARDGRKFGPLPKTWADYKGLYRSDDKIVISYSVGASQILERLSMEKAEDQTVFTRTLNISPSQSILKLKVAPIANKIALSGSGATLSKEDGFHIIVVNKSQAANLKIYIGDASIDNFDQIAQNSDAPETLSAYTKGGPAKYPEVVTSTIIKGDEDNLFAVDQLSPPFDNPWDCRMKLSGIDFFTDSNKAAACTTDGDVFLITGLLNGGTELKWKRIAAGLFQPLGLKIVNEKIYVTCRDQLVRLQDLNGDDETDFYESFNHDHQVTDHFHEFAMGLQVDPQGNLYYAKSGRHAREALIPQHGTLIKVSKDGLNSEIIASGFRAANGVCINPDGSFLVTDQQGYWNPMNRINWIDVSGESKFYGNMWGYNPPPDSSDQAMEQPMVWVDMEFDRSPSELLWVDSKKWGPLNGSLLSFSYGYGKIQLVLHEEVDGQKQGGVIDIPGMRFYTGVMRGRFHPTDGHLYLCGMEAWSTSQNMRTGDLYRIRYTGEAMTLPVGLNASTTGVTLKFAEFLDPSSASNPENYEVQTWDIVRSKSYGSDRYDTKTLKITSAKMNDDGRSITLVLPDISPIDVMTISFNIQDGNGNDIEGTVQNTIHKLSDATVL